MRRWWSYFREQFPLGISFVLGSGIAFSGALLQNDSFHIFPLLLSLVGILLFFVVWKLMNDVNNVEKDRILHKNYPLVNGTIRKTEALYVIKVLQISMLVYGLLLLFTLHYTAAIAYLCIAFYAWLAGKDFFLKKFLGHYRFLQGLCYQFIIVPVAIFSATISSSDAILAPATWSFALMLLGGFFCYDLCQKLNPQTHPVLATYIHFYGFRRTFEIAILALAVAAIGASLLHLSFLLAPWEIIVAASLLMLFFQMSAFRFAEAAVMISLLAHVWGVVLYRALQN